MKRTDAGRPVYSGGGIEPDKRVDGPLEGFNPTKFGRTLAGRGEFANYAQKFTAEGDTRISQQSTGRRNIIPNFVVDEAMLADFKDHLKNEMKLKIDEEGFAKDLDFIKAMIHFEIDVAVFGVSEAQKNLIARDPQAQFGLAQFNEAIKLTELARARMNSRGGQQR
jgi:hypothetical protein